MFIASCGSAGGGKKIAKNDFLGDLPNLIYQKNLIDSIRNAEEKAATAKLNPNEKSDREKAVKISDKFKARKQAENEKYDANVEKIKAELVGKSIPFEVEEGTGYEITYCKISDVQGRTIYVEFEVKITDVKTAEISRYGKPEVFVMAQSIDKNGNQIGADGGYNIDITDRADGATGKDNRLIAISQKYVEKYADFAKFRFIKNK